MAEFQCISCGICCRIVGRTVAAAKELINNGDERSFVKEIAGFPFDTDENGACINLKSDNSCAVYEDRPDICSVKKTREKHYPETSEEKYFEDAWKSCLNLMEQFNYKP